MADFDPINNPEDIPTSAPPGMKTATPRQANIDFWDAVHTYVRLPEMAMSMFVGDEYLDRNGVAALCFEKMTEAHNLPELPGVVPAPDAPKVLGEHELAVLRSAWLMIGEMTVAQVRQFNPSGGGCLDEIAAVLIGLGVEL